ncbi:MAG: hypothetical protein ACOZCL_13480 [Bacillota bacterium]
MKRFFRGLVVFILVMIIVSGSVYIGYNYLYTNQNAMLSHGSAYSNTYMSNDIKSQQQNSHSGMIMDQSKPKSVSSYIGTIETIMTNKASLDKGISLLKQSIKHMTLDPYSPDTENVNSSTTDNAQNESSTTVQNNKVFAMSNMGTRYDVVKMEQLHKGIYKLSVGMLLLSNIDNELTIQAEFAAVDNRNELQHYSELYTLTLQNKSKLNQALMYINDAAELVNINPYVGESGIIYDKDRMSNIHESIVKMAEGVATLNILNDELARQSVDTAAKVQNIMHNADTSIGSSSNADGHSYISTDTAHQTAPVMLPEGYFSKINIPSLLNIVLVVFIALFIFGLFGFILSLLKPKQAQSSSIR